MLCQYRVTSLQILLVGCLGIQSSIAAVFPRGCEVTGFGFKENYLVLNEKGEQSLFLIQNHSDKKIELEHHETQEVFMSPQLQSKIEAGNWSAFASDVQGFYFKCFKYEDDNKVDQVNCSEVLEICQYPRVKFALSNMGTYWISTNKAQEQVVKDATAKGLYLKW